jgi:hypothetical protein
MVVQTGESIECDAIHGHKDGGREQRLFVKRHPVDTVVIRHASLNYPTPLQKSTLLYLQSSDGSIAIGQSAMSETMETRGQTWDRRTPTERSWDASELSPTKGREQRY